ncbi:alpha/beta hydrolase fold domain-containing protein [uncultured Fibrella sp.]|uniref:alpha/beta hydrolase fold domain-containing protein n=1 Tax=uncultured Fibrella sp. TaxID=1284596 RepID=UPI0035CA4CCB
MRKLSRLFWLVSLCCCGTTAFSQSVNGLTGKRDTSFTTWGSYQKIKGRFPDVRFVSTTLPAGVTARMDLVYCRQNGRELHLDAFYPTKTTSRQLRPAVLLIHGGGWRSGDRSQHVPMAQQLAAAGYVAVTAEYRLSTEAQYPAAVHDLKAAIRWLRANARQYAIDTNRIATLGFSAGGQLAALLGASGNVPALEGTDCNQRHSTAVQAVVDMDGLLAFDHPESGEGDDSKSTSAATYWFGGPKAQTLALWHEASALTYAKQQTAPILFINSSVDRMHAGRDDLRRELTARGIYSEVHTFPDAPHVFCLFHPWFEPTMAYTITFLNKVLKAKS